MECTGKHMFNLVAESAVCSAVILSMVLYTVPIHYYDAIHSLVNIEDDLMYLAYRCPNDCVLNKNTFIQVLFPSVMSGHVKTCQSLL